MSMGLVSLYDYDSDEIPTQEEIDKYCAEYRAKRLKKLRRKGVLVFFPKGNNEQPK